MFDAAKNLGKQAAKNAADYAGKTKETPIRIDTTSQPRSKTTNLEEGVSEAVHEKKK